MSWIDVNGISRKWNKFLFSLSPNSTPIPDLPMAGNLDFLGFQFKRGMSYSPIFQGAEWDRDGNIRFWGYSGRAPNTPYKVRLHEDKTQWVIIYGQQAITQPRLYLEPHSFPWVFLLFLESSFKNCPICFSKASPRQASGGWKLTPPRFLDPLDHGMG